MDPDERKHLEATLQELEARLEDRRRALPAHSVRPHQIIAIEELEEQIAEIRQKLTAHKN